MFQSIREISEIILPAGRSDGDLKTVFPAALLTTTDGQDRDGRSHGYELLGAALGDANFSQGTIKAEQKRPKLLWTL